MAYVFLLSQATFAFMWKMTASSIESINKPIPRRNVHPEMEDIQSGEELLVFKPENDRKMMTKETLLLLENDQFFTFAAAGLLNLLFYIFAIGFVISLVLEQFVKDNEHSTFLLYKQIEGIVGDRHG